MIDYINKSLNILKNEINENKIKLSLEKIKNINPLINHNDKYYWYIKSYNAFLDVFSKTRGAYEENTWIQRIACVYSWVAGIPCINFETINILVEIDKIYNKFKIWELNIASYLGGQGDSDRLKHHGEIIFESIDCPPILIRDFLEPANKLINNDDKWENSISITSKLLHFMMPNLLPIFDSHLCNIIFKNKYNSYAKYHGYIFAIMEFLINNKYIINIAEDNLISPLRLIELVLYEY